MTSNRMSYGADQLKKGWSNFRSFASNTVAPAVSSAAQSASRAAQSATVVAQGATRNAGSNVATFIKNVREQRAPGSTAASLGIHYITKRVLSMGFPYQAEAKPPEAEATIDQLAEYLDARHAEKYMIFNISEKLYDYSKFHDQVMQMKFPAYPAPPLDKVFEICASIDSWLHADSENVAVIHCQTGKGRTMSTIACYLAWNGEFPTPTKALKHSCEIKGVTPAQILIPTQRRYLNYYSRVLVWHEYPLLKPTHIDRVIMNGVPNFENQTCRPYLQIFKNAKLVYTTYNRGKPLKTYSQEDQSILFPVDITLEGDILVRVRHFSKSGKCFSMIRFGFHAGYIAPGVTRLVADELDGACKDMRFPEGFWIDVTASKAVDAEGKPVEGSIKDPTFWKTVSTRKEKPERKDQPSRNSSSSVRSPPSRASAASSSTTKTPKSERAADGAKQSEVVSSSSSSQHHGDESEDELGLGPSPKDAWVNTDEEMKSKLQQMTVSHSHEESNDGSTSSSDARRTSEDILLAEISQDLIDDQSDFDDVDDDDDDLDLDLEVDLETGTLTETPKKPAKSPSETKGDEQKDVASGGENPSASSKNGASSSSKSPTASSSASAAPSSAIFAIGDDDEDDDLELP